MGCGLGLVRGLKYRFSFFPFPGFFLGGVYRVLRVSRFQD